MNNYIVITPFFPSSKSFRGSYLLDQAKAIQSNSNYKLLVIILSSFYEKSQGRLYYRGCKLQNF